MAELTSTQAAAIERTDRGLALSAGAGCGKTRVLAERFLAQLASRPGRSLAELVAMTFTEKAARELRDRVRKTCRARMIAETDEQEMMFWRDVGRGLEAAPIGTIHSFCSRLLRRHALRCGIDPEFEVLDVAVAPTLRKRSVDHFLGRRLADRDDDLHTLAVAWGLDATREAIEYVIEKRAIDDPERTAGRSPDEILAIWKGFRDETIAPRLTASLNQTLADCRDRLIAGDCRQEKIKLKIEQLFDRIEEFAGATKPEESIDALNRLRSSLSLSGTRAEYWASQSAYDDVKSAFAETKKAIDDFLQLFQHDKMMTDRSIDRSLRLARLARGAIAEHDRSKRSESRIDFDDLLIKTRDLLRDYPDIRDECSRMIRFILVDEFQDTDPVQAEILEALRAGDRIVDGLFFVGDVKQSIYRFRGAKPELFGRFSSRMPKDSRLALTENFRASAGLIDFTNTVFADHFSAPEHRLVPGLGRIEEDRDPRVEFLWPIPDPTTDREGGDAGVDSDDSDSDSNSDVGSKLSADELRVIEAKRLARRIAVLLDEGLPIRDPKTATIRPANGGDIAILFRAMTNTAVYEQALTEEGLDYHIVGGAAFFARDEVRDLINVLAAIDDPLDEVSLTGALRSPFFGISDEGLFWLAEGSDAGLVEGFERVNELNNSDKMMSRSDRRRVNRARSLLARWRGLKDRVRPSELVAFVLDESGYEAALLAEFLGERKRANARKLIRLARSFDDVPGVALGDFVAKLRDDVRTGPREEEAATTEEEGESIRIMSIHQSKGLEFPIVVVADLSRPIAPRTGKISVHATLGIVARPDPPPGAGIGDQPEVGESLGIIVHKYDDQYEDKLESLRLFYVATTRARDYLILSSAGEPDRRASGSPALSLLSKRFDLRTGEPLVRVDGDWKPPLVRVVGELPPPLSRSRKAPRPSRLELARTITRRIGSETDRFALESAAIRAGRKRKKSGR